MNKLIFISLNYAKSMPDIVTHNYYIYLWNVFALLKTALTMD